MPILPANNVEVRDEGVSQGFVRALNFTGAPVTASVSGSVATIAVSSGGGGSSITDFTQDLGVAQRSGTFDLTGLTGLTTGKNVIMTQTRQPISAKGNAVDEGEMDMIQLYGAVVNSTTIRCSWWAPSVVVGVYAFGYTVGA